MKLNQGARSTESGDMASGNRRERSDKRKEYKADSVAWFRQRLREITEEKEIGKR